MKKLITYCLIILPSLLLFSPLTSREPPRGAGMHGTAGQHREINRNFNDRNAGSAARGYEHGYNRGMQQGAVYGGAAQQPVYVLPSDNGLLPYPSNPNGPNQ